MHSTHNGTIEPCIPLLLTLRRLLLPMGVTERDPH